MPTDGRETGAQRQKLDHREREQRLLRLAGRQHGVVTFEQLVVRGFSEWEIARRIASGRLHRLYRAVYAVGRADVSTAGRYLAAVLACGDGATLSRLSAADHLGLRRTSSALIHVSIRRRSSLRHDGLRVHRTTTLGREDIAVVSGVPCTGVARTIFDAASLLDHRAIERMVEQAVILEVYDQRAVDELLGRLAGQPGSRRLAAVVAAAKPGATVTNSDLEEVMLALCRRGGLPDPQVNAWLRLGDEYFQIDFLWREQRVAVEVDSFRYHRGRRVFTSDRRRDRLLTLAGWTPARFADEDLTSNRGHVEHVLRHLLSG